VEPKDKFESHFDRKSEQGKVSDLLAKCPSNQELRCNYLLRESISVSSPQHNERPQSSRVDEGKWEVETRFWNALVHSIVKDVAIFALGFLEDALTIHT
jgi:hypothetical protein